MPGYAAVAAVCTIFVIQFSIYARDSRVSLPLLHLDPVAVVARCCNTATTSAKRSAKATAKATAEAEAAEAAEAAETTANG